MGRGGDVPGIWAGAAMGLEGKVRKETGVVDGAHHVLRGHDHRPV